MEKVEQVNLYLKILHDGALVRLRITLELRLTIKNSAQIGQMSLFLRIAQHLQLQTGANLRIAQHLQLQTGNAG
jgi:hypothetical protein